jgi:hypothetical protein
MSVPVTLTARGLVDASEKYRADLLVEEAKETALTRLRARVQSVIGYIHVWGMQRFTHVRELGARICTDALAELPDEIARHFLPLAAIPHTAEAFDGTFADLSAIFGSVLSNTERFQLDPEGH